LLAVLYTVCDLCSLLKLWQHTPCFKLESHVTPDPLPSYHLKKRTEEKILKIIFAIHTSRSCLATKYISLSLVSRWSQSRHLVVTLHTIDDGCFVSCDFKLRLWKDFYCFCAMARLSAPARGTSLSALLRSYFKVTYYSGLLPASSSLHIASAVQEVGYRVRIISPSRYVYVLQVTSRTLCLVFGAEPLQTTSHAYIQKIDRLRYLF